MDQTNSFINLFFNTNEEACFSHNEYANESVSVEQGYLEPYIFCTINPVKGKRQDINTTAFRSFMVELDDMPIQDQMSYIKQSKFPYSYCCFSGNKSLHFALVLSQDLPDLKIYKHVYQWILNILTKADQKTKNPTRQIRMPNVYRPETGKLQALIYMGKRIDLAELVDWLHQHKDKEPKAIVPKVKNTGEANVHGIKPWAIKLLKEGVHNSVGSRNQNWMSVGCEFGLNGFSLDQTIGYLEGFFQEQTDFTYKEWETAVTSGWKHADKI